jgi:UDP-3-O-[3-hydroxymyristoyl] glucosamine N-acyltransferase
MGVFVGSGVFVGIGVFVGANVFVGAGVGVGPLVWALAHMLLGAGLSLVLSARSIACFFSYQFLLFCS